VDELSGRVALVTGGSRGLGREMVLAFAERGARVVIASRKLESCRAVADEVERRFGAEALPVAVNVSDWEQCDRLVEAAYDRFGRVDVLVNNAGTCIHRPALEVTPEEWREVFAVNVDGLWNCSQAFGRHMVAAGRGSIVNIGSMSGLVVNRPQWQPAYNASKAAVHQLTKSLAAEWAPAGVRVNALAPGYVKTEMAPVDEPQFHRHWIEDTPMQRYATPQELGPSVVYLASDASSFTTGSVLVADGGYSVF
jgi:NAD(P)-dependent dehydrogenase (short-subunit alcohol dehydrogenase family)